MPTYEVTIPGKGTFEVTSEKELTEKEAYNYALSQSGGETKQAAPQSFLESLKTAVSTPIKNVLNLEPFNEAVARGMFVDPAAAIGQLVTRGIGVGQETADQLAAENERRLAELPTSGRIAGNIMSPATGTLAQIPSALSRIPMLSGTGLAPTAVRSAITGAVGAPLMAPATGENFAQEKAIQTGMGAALGPVFDIAAAPLARLGTPSARPELAELQRRGVDVSQLSYGQQLGGAAQRMEQALTSTPVIGSLVRAAEQKGFEEFNRGLINSIITQANPSATLPKAVSTRGAVEFAGKELSKAYNKALAPIKITPSAELYTDISTITSQYAAQLGDDNAKLLDKLVQNRVTDLIPENKVLPGGTAKRIDSDLGSLERKYKKSANAQDQTIGEAIGEIKFRIRDEIAAQDPTGKVADLNKAFAEFVRVERAAASSRLDGGVFTPEQLLAASRSMDESRRKGSFARGQALMQRAGEAGRTVLGSQVPDSGTAERIMSQTALAGLAAALAKGAVPEPAVGPLLAGGGLAALYSRPGQAMIRGLAPLGPGLRAVSPIVGPATLNSLLD